LDELNDRQIRVLRGFAKHNIRDADSTENDIRLLGKLGLIKPNPLLPGMRISIGFGVSDDGREWVDWYEKNY
jgi:hypothetical protein